MLTDIFKNFLGQCMQLIIQCVFRDRGNFTGFGAISRIHAVKLAEFYFASLKIQVNEAFQIEFAPQRAKPHFGSAAPTGHCTVSVCLCVLY